MAAAVYAHRCSCRSPKPWCRQGQVFGGIDERETLVVLDRGETLVVETGGEKWCIWVKMLKNTMFSPQYDAMPSFPSVWSIY